MSTVTEIVELEDQDALDEWLSEFDEPFAFVTDRHGQPLIVWGSEDGDWYATRPPNEDDTDAEGHVDFPPPFDAAGLALPVVVIVTKWADDGEVSRA